MGLSPKTAPILGGYGGVLRTPRPSSQSPPATGGEVSEGGCLAWGAGCGSGDDAGGAEVGDFGGSVAGGGDDCVGVAAERGG